MKALQHVDGRDIRQTCTSLDAGEESREEDRVEGVMGKSSELLSGKSRDHQDFSLDIPPSCCPSASTKG